MHKDSFSPIVYLLLPKLILAMTHLLSMWWLMMYHLAHDESRSARNKLYDAIFNYSVHMTNHLVPIMNQSIDFVPIMNHLGYLMPTMNQLLTKMNHCHDEAQSVANELFNADNEPLCTHDKSFGAHNESIWFGSLVAQKWLTPCPETTHSLPRIIYFKWHI